MQQDEAEKVSKLVEKNKKKHSVTRRINIIFDSRLRVYVCMSCHLLFLINLVKTGSLESFPQTLMVLIWLPKFD